MRSCAWAAINCAACERWVAVASSTAERWPAGVFSSDCARASWIFAFASRALASATAASCCATAASNGGRSSRYSRSPSCTSVPSMNSRCSRNAVTRAVITTRSTACTRPMNSEVSVTACFSARTTPTAGGPLGIWASATATPSSTKNREQRGEAAQGHQPSFRIHAAMLSAQMGDNAAQHKRSAHLENHMCTTLKWRNRQGW